MPTMTTSNVPDLSERYGWFKCELCEHWHKLDPCPICKCVNESAIEDAYETALDREDDNLE